MKLDAPPTQWLPETQQRLFRLLLQASSYPGDVQNLGAILGDTSAAVATLATLVDEEVTFADLHDLLSTADRGFLSKKEAQAHEADYILVRAERTPDFEPKIGTIYRPESSATVIIACASLSVGAAWSLTGPGIETETVIQLDPAVTAWFEWRDTHVRYPQGVDLILCDASAVLALPRTTKIQRGAL